MKKFVLFISVILVVSLFSFALATEVDESYFVDDSGESVESGEYNLNDDAVLLDSEEDLNKLYGGQGSTDDEEESQEELKAEFLDQHAEIAKLTEKEPDEKFVITKVLSGVKSQYISESYYVYIVKYQVVNIRVEEDEIPAVIVLSYDISDSKNVKPVKVGDTLFGYIEHVSVEDATYGMVEHGLTDTEIAYVSISSQDRTLGVILLTVLAILLVCLYAGKNGAKLLIPVFVLLDLLFVVFTPEMEMGRSAIILSSAIALEIIILITVLKNGWSRKTIVALVSSIIVVVLVATLGIMFGNANGFSGKGLISEEKYDLLANVYYIDSVFKMTVSIFDIYVSIIILISSIVVALIASKVVGVVEKYAGTEGMVNSIIEEAKDLVAEYPLILTGLFIVMYLPQFMITSYNHVTFDTLINDEILVTNLAVGLMVVIGSLIVAPITAIVGYLFMGKVEVKQIEE